MSRALEFSPEDIETLNKIPNLLKSLEECLDQIRPSLQKHFGEINPRSLNKHKKPRLEDKANFYGQLYSASRYTLFKHHILKDTSQWSSLYASIQLSENNSYAKPSVILNIWIDDCHPINKDVTDDFHVNKNFLNDINLRSDEEGFDAIYEKPLSGFLSEPDQFLAIKQWYEERITLLYNYMVRHSKIEWDIIPVVNDNSVKLHYPPIR